MKRWLIGCSGFSYRHWKGEFYPDDVPARRWFEYYCEHFNTVELNVTFYRMPKPETFRAWYERSPADFRFTVKAPRLITHFRKFLNTKNDILNFYNTIEKGLGGKLGTVLFQLPPNLVYSEENLERILLSLDDHFSNVIEFRDQSWWNPRVLDELKLRNVTFCGISYPGLPDDVTKTNPVMYYRFHGVPDLYRSAYKLSELKKVVNEISTKRSVEEVYIYFNNDINVSAIDNARQVQKLVGSNRSSVQKPKKKASRVQ
ncbi:MAG TPA: DUF72 domain-containing protein [Chryseosolibacter sp.]|nr:DUF72 domain-containing protein [Chryseosolibacter sp.]